VQRALEKLRQARLLSLEGIREAPVAQLEELIRSSGYYRQKTQRLKGFVTYLDARYNGSLEQMFSTPTEELRAELLTQKGIGPETADAILLYAGHHEVFVVDAYARRILERHGIIAANTKYDEVRTLVERGLRSQRPEVSSEDHDLSPSRPAVHAPTTMSSSPRTEQAQIYNEMHGLMVQLGKHHCFRTQPECNNCPLGAMLSPETRRRLTQQEENTRAPGLRASRVRKPWL
jgi:endonuclease-3 related protein